MKRKPLTYIDWNGPYRESTIADPTPHYAFHKTRSSPKLRPWEFVVIIAACVFTLLCIVWAKG